MKKCVACDHPTKYKMTYILFMVRWIISYIIISYGLVGSYIMAEVFYAVADDLLGTMCAE